MLDGSVSLGGPEKWNKEPVTEWIPIYSLPVNGEELMLELELCWLLIDCAEEVFLSQKGESIVWGCPFSRSLALLRKNGMV